MAIHAISMVGAALLATPTSHVQNFPLMRFVGLAALNAGRCGCACVLPFVFAEDGRQHPVRMYQAPGETLFLAADVCAAIGIGDMHAALDLLPDDEAIWIDSDGAEAQSTEAAPAAGLQVAAVTEAGLYSLIHTTADDGCQLGDRARRFERWVTHELVPALQVSRELMSGVAS